MNDWIRPGAEAVIHFDGYYRQCIQTVITKVTKTQIVVKDSASRFRISDLTEIGGRRTLLDPKNPSVRKMMAEARELRFTDRAESAIRKFSQNRCDVQARNDLRRALSELVNAMDAVDGDAS